MIWSEKTKEAFLPIYKEYGFSEAHANAYPAHCNASFALEMFARGYQSATESDEWKAKDQEINCLKSQVDYLDQEIERLRKRLEIYDSNGDELPESADGIACRDETIKLQDARIERLRQPPMSEDEAVEIIALSVAEYNMSDKASEHEIRLAKAVYSALLARWGK